MTGKENALASSPVRSLRLEGAPLEPATPGAEREQNKASKDFSFPALAGAARDEPRPRGRAGNRAAAKRLAESLAASPAAAGAAAAAAAAKAPRPPHLETPPGRRTGQKTYTPHKGSGGGASSAAGRTAAAPLSDATNKQPSPSPPRSPPQQPPAPVPAPSTPPQQLQRGWPGQPQLQRFPVAPVGYPSPGLPYNPYQQLPQQMYPPWTPHPAFLPPARHLPAPPLSPPPPGQLQPYGYPLPPSQPPPGLSYGLQPRLPASPPGSPPQPLALAWNPRELWANPLMGYAAFPGSPQEAALSPWLYAPSPFYGQLPPPAWLGQREREGLNVRKMASLCFQASSKGAKAALTRQEVRALVQHQLRAQAPVHAPWYRRAAAAKPASPPGRLLEDKSSPPPAGAGTGVWFPKS